MMGKTHLAAGLIAGHLAMTATGQPASAQDGLILITASAIGSLLPDIDHFNSTISRASTAGRVLSAGITAITKHRGAIHTPLAILITSLMIFLALGSSRPLVPVLIGTSVGMLSHLIMDSLNPGGIMWLFPFVKTHIHIANIKTRSKTEVLFVMPSLYALFFAIAGQELLEALRKIGVI